MKIALFVDTFFPMVDGVIQVVDNYAKRLAEYAEVTVFCPRPFEKEFDDSVYNFKVVRCKSFRKRNYDYPVPLPFFDGKFKRAIREGGFDIVHIHDPFFVARQGVKYAKSHKIPLVATLHSQYKRDFFRATHSRFLTRIALFISMPAFNACDECWAVNGAVKKLYLDEYGLKSPCTTSYNATDMTPVDATAAAQTVNELYGISENENVLLFSGRLNMLKNILLIAESLKIVNEAGISFKMLFVGKGPDEDEHKLHAEIESFGLSDRIIFTGRIEDRSLLAKIYSRADLFLFPSMYDANSLVQIEAAAQNTPTVFIRGSATSSTATENVNCLMSDETPEAFAAEIIRALSDRELLFALGKNAFRDLYRTWDDAVDDVFAKYVTLIEKKAEARGKKGKNHE